MSGRIVFPGNPWPGGHAAGEFEWAGRLDVDGRLWFDLTITSVDYRSEAEPAVVEDGNDWTSPIVWDNYHGFSAEPARGLLAAQPGHPFPLHTPHTLTADPLGPGRVLPDPDAEPAWFCYLLGHDSLAEHTLTFTPAGPVHDLDWTAAVALTYAGDHVFRHGMHARLTGVTLTRIRVPEGPDPYAALARVLHPADGFELDGTWLVRR